MTPKIKHQKSLMQTALSLLNDIETIDRLVKPVDGIYAKVMTAELQRQYAEVLQLLAGNFYSIAMKHSTVDSNEFINGFGQ